MFNAKLLSQLLIIAVSVLVLMTIYEVLKQAISPDITIWESHIITIVFSTICATVSSHFVLKKQITLNEKLSKKNIEKEQAQKMLEDTIEKLEVSLSEVKVLSGLLPICASCKKIRDDNGYWSRIESFIENRTDVDFSHSMCPECSDKLYGDQAWYIKMKNKKNGSGNHS